ncbi:MAG: Flp family type IVb pilin [Alphaproteobacteria bacterium]
MTNMIKGFIRDEDGATAIEYGMIAAGIGVAIMVTVFTLGDDLDGLFTDVSDQVNSRANQ